MSERLTAEREARYRAELAAAAVETRDEPTIDAFEEVARDLLAELDAVRAERDEARALLSVARGLAEDAGAESKDTRVRAERAEAGLAALRAVALPHVGAEFATEDETRALKAALADTAAAAEAYTRRVRAEALEAAAAFVARNYTGDDMPSGSEIADDLRTFAADERGGR